MTDHIGRGIVTFETVGEYAMTNPWARGAAQAGISQLEFIQMLLGEVERLTAELIDAESRAMPRPVFPDQP